MLVSLLLTACDYFTSESDLITQANNELLAGNINAANLYAKKVLKKNISNGEARFIMAEIANLQGRIRDAEIDYRRAYEANHDVKVVLPPFIATLMLQKNHNDIPALVEGLPTDMSAKKEYWMGLFYLSDNYLDQALQQFNKSINLAQEPYAEPFFGKALIAVSKNDYKTAIQHIDDALNINKMYLDALLMKAELYVKLKQDNQALPILLGILKRDINTIPAKKHFIAKSTLIQICWRNKDVKLAEKHAVELLQRYRSNPIANYYAAMIHFEYGRYSLANNFLQQVLRSAPEHNASLSLMGSVKYKQGFYEQADFYLSSALANDPDNAEITKLLASTRLKQNQTTSAIDLLDDTSTRESDPLILWLSGKAKLQSGDTQEGLTLLKQAASLSNESDEMHLDIAQTYLSLGQLDAAIAELNNLDNFNKADSQKHLFYIYDHIQKGDYKQALSETERLIKQDPEKYSLYIARGKIYQAMQQDNLAIASFKQAAQGDNIITANLELVAIYMEQKDYANAKQALNTILQIQSEHYQALTGLVQIAILEQDDKAYQKHIEKLQKLHPDNAQSFLIQAAKQLGDKNYTDAEETLKKVMQLDGGNVTGILMLTSAYIQNKKLNPAILFLEDKLRLPELKKISHLHYQLAMLHMQNDDVDKSIRSVKTAYKLRPSQSQYVVAYTKLLKKTNNIDKAEEVLQDFIQINPNDSQGYVLLGDLYFSQRAYQQALSNYQKAYSMQTSEALTIKLYRTQKLNKEPAAIITLENWLKNNPNSMGALAELAGHLLTQGQYKQAAQTYEKVLANSDPHPGFLNNLAWAYLQLNNNRAIETARKAYKLAPQSPEVADTYGWILVNMGKLSEGLTLLEKAYTSRPESLDMQYHLAYALSKAGKIDRAQNLLKAMLDNPSAKQFHQKAKQLLNEIS